MICDACDFYNDGKQDCKNCWVYKMVDNEKAGEVLPNPNYCRNCELEFGSAECWGNDDCKITIKEKCPPAPP